MDLIDFARYFAALAVVLGMLGLLALGARRGWLAGLVASVAARGASPGTPRRARRMRIAETLVLDARRRIVILRVDGMEHVVLLGPERETLMDSRPAPEEEK